MPSTTYLLGLLYIHLLLLLLFVLLLLLQQPQTVAVGEFDFLHAADHPVNARQWIATHLDPYDHLGFRV